MDGKSEISRVEGKGNPGFSWGSLVLIVVSVLVLIGFPYSMWRISLLTENQDLLFHSLSVKSEKMPKAKAREYMKSQGYNHYPAHAGDRDYFYLGTNSANKDWVLNGHRAYIDYKNGLASDAGIEVIHGYF